MARMVEALPWPRSKSHSQAPERVPLSSPKKLVLKGVLKKSQRKLTRNSADKIDSPASSFEVFSVEDPTDIKRLQSWTYTLSQPGPKPAQNIPHPHEAILDPTGQYVLVPDLGADLVRVFAINQESYQLTPVTPLNVAVGSGPRHARFLVTKDKTYFFVLAELGNIVTTYEVHYGRNKTLSFTEVFSVGTHGPDSTVPVGAAAAEIHISVSTLVKLISRRG